MVWFSGMCVRLCILDGVGAITREESVYVFKATDRAAAVRRFLQLAREQDQEYENVNGERVRWAVSSLETVDELEEGKLGDREVFSKMTDIEPPDASVSFAAVFTPDVPEPGYSGV